MQHNDPAFIDDPHAPAGMPPIQGLRWYGHRRLVHRQRARKLRKRGVALQVVAPGVWAWYESEQSYKMRELLRRLKHCHKPVYWNNDGLVLMRDAFGEILKHNFREIEARVNAFYESVAIEAATGHALDALCRIPLRPAGMTDDEVRSLYRNGYMLTVNKSLGPLTELQEKAAKYMQRSPVVTMYYFDEFQHLPTEGWPTDKPFETGPFPLGVLHVKPADGDE